MAYTELYEATIKLKKKNIFHVPGFVSAEFWYQAVFLRPYTYRFSLCERLAYARYCTVGCLQASENACTDCVKTIFWMPRAI